MPTKTKRELLLLALKNPGQAILGLLMLGRDKYKQIKRRARWWSESVMKKIGKRWESLKKEIGNG